MAAFETLGINLVVNGTKSMINAIDNISNSLQRYDSAVQRVQKQALKIAMTDYNTANRQYTNISNLIQQMSQRIIELHAARLRENALARTTSASNIALINNYNALIAAIKRSTAGGPQTAQQVLDIQNYQKAIQAANGAVTAHRQAARSALNEEKALRADLTNRLGEQTWAEQVLERAQGELLAVEQKFGMNGQTLSKIVSVLSGNFKQFLDRTLPLTASLSTLGPEAAALGVVMDTVAIAFRAVIAVGRFVINIVGDLIKVIGSGISKVFEFGVNLVKWVGKGLWDIAKAPFQFIVNGFNAFGDSLKRILEITIGMGLENVLFSLASKIRALGVEAFDAGADFQLMQVRLTGLLQRDMAEQGLGTFAENLYAASDAAGELSKWISQLAVKTIFNAETINDTMTLAMAYDFTSEEAKSLTMDLVNFSTGMGLSNDQMRRIIENFGQMRAAGKMAGTEMRDLARGSFVPILAVFREMAQMPEAAQFIKELPKTHEVLPQFAGKTTEELNNLIKAGTQVSRELPMDLDKVAAALKVVGAKGLIPTDLFFKAFSVFTNKNFQGAIDKTSKTFRTVASNAKDFLQSVIGWRIVTPILNAVSGKLADAMNVLMSDDMISRFEAIGLSMARIVETAINAFDSMFKADRVDVVNKMVGGIEDFIKEIEHVAFTLEMFDLRTALMILLPDEKFAAALYDNLLGPIQNITNGPGSITEKVSQIVGIVKTYLIETVLPIVQQKWAEIWGGIKDKFNEYMGIVTTFLNDKLITGLDNLNKWVADHSDVLAPVVKSISNLILAIAGGDKEGLPAQLESIKFALSNLWDYGVLKYTNWKAENSTNLGTMVDGFVRLAGVSLPKDTIDGIAKIGVVFQDISNYASAIGSVASAFAGLVNTLWLISPLKTNVDLLGNVWKVFYPETGELNKGNSLSTIIKNIAQWLNEAVGSLNTWIGDFQSWVNSMQVFRLNQFKVFVDVFIELVNKFIAATDRLNAASSKESLNSRGIFVPPTIGTTPWTGGRAKGGTLAAGEMSWVGELGKELVMPMTNSMVIPNWASTKFAANFSKPYNGSNTIVNNVYNSYNLSVNSNQYSQGIMEDFEIMKLRASA